MKEYYRQLEGSGEGGHRLLENGRYRFYGEITPARTPGQMLGGRLVREWNPLTNGVRSWYEIFDYMLRVRSVAPKPPAGSLNHRIFDISVSMLLMG